MREIRRSRLSTAILFIELVTLSIMFLLILKTVRTRFAEHSIDEIGDRVANKVVSTIWNSSVNILDYQEEILSGRLDELPKNMFPLPPEKAGNERAKANVDEIPLTDHSGISIYLGTPEQVPPQGLLLPFFFHLPGGEVTSGWAALPGLNNYFNELKREDILIKISGREQGNIIFDSTLKGEESLFNQLIHDHIKLEEKLDSFGISVEIIATHGAIPIPLTPQIFIIACYLVFVVFLVIVHGKIVKPSSMALDLLRENLKHLELDCEEKVLRENIYLYVNSLISAHKKLEDGYNETLARLEDAEGETLEDLKKNNKELLIHHSVTKKMIKALNYESIVPTLKDGIRELGFKDILWGEFQEESKSLRFILDKPANGKSSMIISLLDDRNFLSRVAWSGEHHFLPSIDSLRLQSDEEVLIGELPTLIIPVVKNSRTKCYDHFKCRATDCKSYMAEYARCWTMGGEGCRRHTPGSYTHDREACMSCPLFTLVGIIIVSSSEEGGILSPQNYSNLLKLANEASLAIELANLYEENERIAVTDSLTGLYNHKEFYHLLSKELERAKRYSTGISLLMIDVDDFKIYNDTYGHIAGDRALKMVTGAIQSAVRKIDLVCRYGGEEFTVILPETDEPGAIALAERIKSAVGALDYSPVDDEKVAITVSIGLCSTSSEVTMDRFVSRADSAAYMAKNMGKNKICVSEKIERQC